MSIRDLFHRAAGLLLLCAWLGVAPAAGLGQETPAGGSACPPATGGAAEAPAAGAPTTGAPAAQDHHPEEIVSWRHRILPAADYVRLAEEWGAFVKRHPADARALVQWGEALRYSGKRDEAAAAYARAFEMAPHDPVVINAHVSMTLTSHGDTADWKLAHARLQEAARLDPTYAVTGYNLWLTSLHEGDVGSQRESLKRLVESGEMPRALVDYGYNMLAGAPRDAIVFTNGDNDTYPPLAAQVMTGLRPDVRIVNISLLNSAWYVRRMREAGVPIGLDDAAIDALKPRANEMVSAMVQRRILEGLARAGWPRPVLYSVTVPDQNRVNPVSTTLEGILARVVALPATGESKTDLDLARTRELLDTVYRLDSMTDPLADWKKEESVARMGCNYPAVLVQVGQRLYDKSPREDGAPYFYQAVSLFAFHGYSEQANQVLSLWAGLDPKAPLLSRARELVSRGK